MKLPVSLTVERKICNSPDLQFARPQRAFGRDYSEINDINQREGGKRDAF